MRSSYRAYLCALQQCCGCGTGKRTSLGCVVRLRSAGFTTRVRASRRRASGRIYATDHYRVACVHVLFLCNHAGNGSVPYRSGRGETLPIRYCGLAESADDDLALQGPALVRKHQAWRVCLRKGSCSRRSPRDSKRRVRRAIPMPGGSEISTNPRSTLMTISAKKLERMCVPE